MNENTTLLRRLYDGIVEMVDEGKLGDLSLPDDHEWLVNLLADIKDEEAETQTAQHTPDMLAALKALLDVQLPSTHCAVGCDICDASKLARTAIAKAEGKT